MSLALIRPRNTQFYIKTKKPEEIEQERRTFAEAASQESFFDKKLKALEPSPYEFRFKFEDAAGSHDYANGDWEAHAMFFNGDAGRNRKAALDWMSRNSTRNTLGRACCSASATWPSVLRRGSCSASCVWTIPTSPRCSENRMAIVVHPGADRSRGLRAPAAIRLASSCTCGLVCGRKRRFCQLIFAGRSASPSPTDRT